MSKILPLENFASAGHFQELNRRWLHLTGHHMEFQNGNLVIYQDIPESLSIGNPNPTVARVINQTIRANAVRRWLMRGYVIQPVYEHGTKVQITSAEDLEEYAQEVDPDEVVFDEEDEESFP